MCVVSVLQTTECMYGDFCLSVAGDLQCGCLGHVIYIYIYVVWSFFELQSCCPMP